MRETRGGNLQGKRDPGICAARNLGRRFIREFCFPGLFVSGEGLRQTYKSNIAMYLYDHAPASLSNGGEIKTFHADCNFLAEGLIKLIFES